MARSRKNDKFDSLEWDYWEDDNNMFEHQGNEVKLVSVNMKSQEFTIPDSVTLIGDSAFFQCALLKRIVIPNSVVKIGNEAFRGCKRLSEVVIPDTVEEIGDMAFMDCSELTEVVIPASVTEIGIGAFVKCKKLKRVVFSEPFPRICYGAFYGCDNLSDIVLPDNVPAIDKSAFEYSINQYIDDSGTVFIPDNKRGSILSKCANVEHYTIPDMAKWIEEGAFKGCTKLKSITVSQKFSDYSFKGCENLTEINVTPWSRCFKSVDGVLYDYSLSILVRCPQRKESVIIPDTVKRIFFDAFDDCNMLKSITIPASVVGIDSYTFRDCKRLTDVFITGTATKFDYLDFGIPKSKKIRVHLKKGSPFGYADFKDNTIVWED